MTFLAAKDGIIGKRTLWRRRRKSMVGILAHGAIRAKL
jgi:hypothetical protein